MTFALKTLVLAAAALAATLTVAHAAPSPQAEQWFLKAKAAEARGDLNGAADAYRQALRHDPEASRVKLDLARVLYRQGQGEESERLFRSVRETNPPAQVIANIDRFLGMMNNRDQTGDAWRARATAGIGYDSNPGTATSAREVTMWGLPFTLSHDARRRGDGFAFFKGEIDHIRRFSREFAWTSNLTINARKYFRLEDYDSFAFSGSTGPVWQPGDRVTALLPAFINVNRFETRSKTQNDRWQSWDYGVAPQVRYAAQDWLSLNLAMTVGRRLYYSESAKDATFASVSPGVDITTPAAGTFTFGASAGRELARASVFANHSAGVNVGWQYAFAQGLVVSAYGSYTDVKYDRNESAYAEARHDRRTVAGLDMIYAWQALQADILLSYAHTWNRSNLPIYAYDRDTISVAIRKAF